MSNTTTQGLGNWGDWQGHYFDKVLGKTAGTGNQITQSQDQFLTKYKDSIDANGNFIPGKANLFYDNENAKSVYDNLIGQHSNGSESYFAPEVNMDWIKDERKGGWLNDHGVNPDTLLSAAALAAGGYGLYSSGLLGGSSAAALEGMPVASTGGVLTEAGVSGSLAGGAGGGLMSGLGGAASAAGNFLKDNQGLATLGAGLLGTALNKDTTTTSSKDPWGPAQQYMKDNLATNANMQAHYAANPFSDQQKQAYQGLLDTNANGMSNAGNYNQIAQNFMGSNRGLMGQMPTLNTGVKAPQVDWSKYANLGKG